MQNATRSDGITGRPPSFGIACRVAGARAGRAAAAPVRAALPGSPCDPGREHRRHRQPLGDFDREFRPLRPELRSRWQRLAQRFPDGDFPPIVVSKLGDAYFVLDGHHRVAVARRIGMETIDAEVTELRTFWQLGPDADPDERSLTASSSGSSWRRAVSARLRPTCASRSALPLATARCSTASTATATG